MGAWAGCTEIDLYRESRRVVFAIVAEAFAGVPPGPEQDALQQAFDATPPSGDPLIRRLVLPLVRARMATAAAAPFAGASRDVLQLLVDDRDDQGCPRDDEHVVAHLISMILAGYETSTVLSAWLLYLLATHHAYLARVHQEVAAVAGDGAQPLTLEDVRALRVLGNALTEAGRLHSPGVAGVRVAVQDVEFAGYMLPAGTRVLYAIAAGHRLPHIFASPDTFDPDRFAPPREEHKRHPYALALFGGGQRTCLGLNLAQVMISILAARALQRYTLTPIEGMEIVEGFRGSGTTMLCLPHGMPMRVAARAAR
jgi:cytochrome P450